jgi:hypothetical protein
VFGFCVTTRGRRHFLYAGNSPRLFARHSFLLVLAAFLFCFCSIASASPLAIFDKSSERSCSGTDVCDLTLFSRQTVGGYTGMTLSRSGSGKGRISIAPGRSSSVVQIESQGAGISTTTLSWDGDPNARVLSGAGLGCFDFRAFHGVAFVIKDFVASADCRDDAGAVTPCADLSIESRLYAASDPTGQVFSWSRIRRKIAPGSARDLVIPFSNFVRSSPRGPGLFECAGALTITFKAVGTKTLKLGMSSVLIDDELGASVRPTPIVTRAANVVFSPTPTELAPTPDPTSSPTAAVAPTGVVELPATSAQTATAVPPVLSPQPTPAVPPASQLSKEGESDVVTTYGNVIAE